MSLVKAYVIKRGKRYLYDVLSGTHHYTKNLPKLFRHIEDAERVCSLPCKERVIKVDVKIQDSTEIKPKKTTKVAYKKISKKPKKATPTK